MMPPKHDLERSPSPPRRRTHSELRFHTPDVREPQISSESEANISKQPADAGEYLPDTRTDHDRQCDHGSRFSPAEKPQRRPTHQLPTTTHNHFSLPPSLPLLPSAHHPFSPLCSPPLLPSAPLTHLSLCSFMHSLSLFAATMEPATFTTTTDDTDPPHSLIPD